MSPFTDSKVKKLSSCEANTKNRNHDRIASHVVTFIKLLKNSSLPMACATTKLIFIAAMIATTVVNSDLKLITNKINDNTLYITMDLFK